MNSMGSLPKSTKTIPKKDFRDSNQAFNTTTGVKSTAQLTGHMASFGNLGNIPQEMINYTSSQKSLKLKFDKTANLANISSLTATGNKSGTNFNADGRYKKKSSDHETADKKKSSQSGRNTNNQVKGAFSMTAGSTKL